MPLAAGEPTNPHARTCIGIKFELFDCTVRPSVLPRTTAHGPAHGCCWSSGQWPSGPGVFIQKLVLLLHAMHTRKPPPVSRSHRKLLTAVTVVAVGSLKPAVHIRNPSLIRVLLVYHRCRAPRHVRRLPPPPGRRRRAAAAAAAPPPKKGKTRK